MRIHTHLLAAVIVVVVPLASCGTQSGVEPEAVRDLSRPSTASDSDSSDALLVPPRVGPADDRGPITRFVGVPLDPAERDAWSTIREQAAVSECMAGLGFEYAPITPDRTDDPNLSYIEGLPEETRDAYVKALWGDDVLDHEDDSCEQTARLRMFPLNSLKAAWEESQAAMFAEPAILEATRRYEECLAVAGYPRGAQAPTDVGDRCGEETGAQDVFIEYIEHYETTFLQEHAQFFIDFKANMPKVQSSAKFGELRGE